MKGEDKMDVIRELENSEFFIEPIPKKVSEAMAYVPYQNAGKLYAPEQALCAGTLFPDLNFPFKGGQKKEGDKNE